MAPCPRPQSVFAMGLVQSLPRELSRGPGTIVPSGRRTFPASRSCTYSRSLGLVASFASFGRFATISAFHCAVVARYPRFEARAAALRRSSREIVDASRLIRRPVSRGPWPCARRIAQTCRSMTPDTVGSARVIGGMPPPSRNQRPPMTSDTPPASAASTVRRPCAIRRHNSRSTHRGKPHLPGERIFGRCARSAACCLLASEHLQVEVLRRPLEFADGLPEVTALQALSTSVAGATSLRVAPYSPGSRCQSSGAASPWLQDARRGNVISPVSPQLRPRWPRCDPWLGSRR
jgi:hypothetical protein